MKRIWGSTMWCVLNTICKSKKKFLKIKDIECDKRRKYHLLEISKKGTWKGEKLPHIVNERYFNMSQTTKEESLFECSVNNLFSLPCFLGKSTVNLWSTSRVFPCNVPNRAPFPSITMKPNLLSSARSAVKASVWNCNREYSK